MSCKLSESFFNESYPKIIVVERKTGSGLILAIFVVIIAYLVYKAIKRALWWL